ncbi:hypothetical protein MTBBW1_710022 [Desulfamplus magnetovallimortis]|uniref:Uncharacterized protein n=1 Tax=Desulfamplus magnetovallimortis TaxID=1246637 RepID=A0A1W1HJ72_9BACT|nr:hypothetical protein MTBBW1_710022 [Desulfamplus magnetovallimortis]
MRSGDKASSSIKERNKPEKLQGDENRRLPEEFKAMQNIWKHRYARFYRHC